MADTRLTLRLSMQDIQVMDMFLRSGEFSTRSEFIRRAIKEYQQNHMEEIIKKAEAVKKLQNIVGDIELGKEYLEP
jgi:Arc/MetJ-type ribon-helix-helix transcriptional regulator